MLSRIGIVLAGVLAGLVANERALAADAPRPWSVGVDARQDACVQPAILASEFESIGAPLEAHALADLEDDRGGFVVRGHGEYVSGAAATIYFPPDAAGHRRQRTLSAPDCAALTHLIAASLLVATDGFELAGEDREPTSAPRPTLRAPTLTSTHEIARTRSGADVGHRRARRSDSEMSFEVSAFLAIGLTPLSPPGAAAGVRLPLASAFVAELGANWVSSPRFVAGGESIDVDLLSARAAGCWRPARRTVEFGACLALSPGRLRLGATDDSMGAARQLPWLGLGGGAYVRGPAREWISMIGRLDVVAPLGRTWLDGAGGRRVYEAAPALVMVSVGVDVEPF